MNVPGTSQPQFDDEDEDDIDDEDDYDDYGGHVLDGGENWM